MNAREKRARLGALNDAVIVSAANRDRFADSELRQSFGRHRLILSRVFDRARSNDQRLPGHQTRRGCYRAYRAGVGERDRRSLEIRDLKFTFASTLYNVVICTQELREAQLVCALDVGNQQIARAIFLRHIDGDTEIDVGPV